MAEQVQELRGKFFRRWAIVSTVMWAALWLSGVVNRGLTTVIALAAISVAGVWVLAWSRSKRMAAGAQNVELAIPTESETASKKAA